MMDCACSMGIGSMTWMMLVPALVLAALVVGGIVLIRRLWPADNATGGEASLESAEASQRCLIAPQRLPAQSLVA